MSEIGWDNGSGFSTTASGVPSFGNITPSMTCGVIGSYGTADFACEWVPVVPGETPGADLVSGAGYFTISMHAYSWPAGTFRVTAVVDGEAASTSCVFAVTESRWVDDLYGGASWFTEGSAPKFWTLFIGTEES